MRKIPLTRGMYALVDNQDYERLAEFNWRAHRTECGYYASSSFWDGEKNHCVYMHRLILGAKKGECTDHSDHNPLNNQRKNITIVTHSQNMRNQRRRSDNTSGVVGVSFNARRKVWAVQICRRYVGTFIDKAAAIRARKNAEAYRLFHKNHGLVFAGGN